MSVHVLPAYLCIMCVPGAHGDQEEGVGSSGPGVMRGCEPLCGLGMEVWSSAGASSPLNHGLISPDPVFSFQNLSVLCLSVDFSLF